MQVPPTTSLLRDERGDEGVSKILVVAVVAVPLILVLSLSMRVIASSGNWARSESSSRSVPCPRGLQELPQSAHSLSIARLAPQCSTTMSSARS